MKIVVAPDSFKESLSAMEVAQAIEKGFRAVFPDAQIEKIPMADGGEGTVQSLVDATGGKIITKEVTGPLGEKVTAFFGVLGDGKTAVIEMAAASGLHLVPVEKRNPLLTTTRGTGELILAALDEGVDHLIIGIGGSATNDGGSGMAQALGARLLDKDRNEIAPGGGSLDKLANIDISELDARLQNVKIEVACDVDNPLIGQDGASHVFGPQKGATPEMVEQLDQNLAHYATILARDLGKDVAHIPGAGAAGGLGAGLLAFLDAELKSGIDIVIAATDLEEKIKDADLVITGEGKIDSQTIHGKTPIGVAKAAKKFNIPVIAICGSIADDVDVVHDHGIDVLFSSLMRITTLEEALESGASNVEKTARNIAALYKLAIGK
ncbi:MAG: glycerate kinase [Caldibacillus sp.]